MSTHWSLIGTLPPLGPGEVQLWRVDLTDTIDSFEPYFPFLSAEEQALASRRRAGRPREHFTIGRACLRILLGNTLGIAPPAVSISNGPHGKPEIAPLSGTPLHFNVAHSKDTILIALDRHSPLGVDIEYPDRSTDIMEVAQAHFTERETASLAAIADLEAQRRLFYTYWTRKEAIVKADGRGLLLALTSFDVAGKSGESSQFMDRRPVDIVDRSEASAGDVKQCFVTDLNFDTGAIGALALGSPEARVRSLIFPLALIDTLGLQKPDRKHHGRN